MTDSTGEGRSLAPELAATVSKAHAELEEAINLGNLHNDPLRFPLRAVATLLQAMHRLCIDYLLTLQVAQQPPNLLSQEAERNLIDRLGIEVERAAWRAQRLVEWRIIAAMCGAVALALVAGTAAGYWRGWVGAEARAIDAGAVLGALPAGEAAALAKLVRNNPPITTLLAAARPITTDGGTAVSLAVWIKPPPAPR